MTAPPPQRMRLGTKSCAECRRRKVRCVFPADAGSCEGCTLHNVHCQPQQPRARRARLADLAPVQNSSAAGAETEALHRRLAQLEAIVSQSSGALVQQGERRSTKESSENTIPTNRDLETSEDSEGTFDDEDDDERFPTAPLPSLGKDALILRPARRHSASEQPQAVNYIKASLHAQRPTLPSSDDLDVLLRGTAHFWPAWPTCTLGIAEPKSLDCGHIEFSKALLLEAIASRDPLLLAKAYLWLALCVSQFPMYRVKAELSLPQPPRALMKCYDGYAKQVLSTVDDFGDSLNGLECYGIQWKMHFDAGRPRKAWQILRQAITSAVQLGLHRKDHHDDERKKFMWKSFWQNERSISCILGLPSCTSDTHPGTGPDDLISEDPLDVAHHKLSIICGKIIERDQANGATTYSATMRIEEELEEVRSILPQVIWDQPQPGDPFVVSYLKHFTRFRFWTIQKLLHLPYMLKFASESKYQHSFDRAMEAAKGALNALNGYRRSTPDIVCDSLDFQAFSAALVYIIGLLARPDAHAQSPKQDWQLVEETSKYLHQTAMRLECSVAKRGTKILDTLISVYNGTYNGPGSFVTMIPYFGRIRLNCTGPASASTHTKTSSVLDYVSSSTTTSTSPLQSFANDDTCTETFEPTPTSIEFSTNEFGQMLPMDFSFGEEINMDWFKFDSADAMDFDWTQEFACSGFDFPL